MMEDNFLNILHEEPSQQFSKRLKSSLDSIPLKIPKAKHFNKSAWMPAVGILLLIIVLVFSLPSVRAAVTNFIVRVADQSFEVSSDYPGLIEPVTTVRPQELASSEAMKIFMVKVPDTITNPDYRLISGPARLYLNIPNFPDMLELKYENLQKEADSVDLNIIRGKTEISHVIGTSKVEEVSIGNGITGALIKGGWFENTKSWENLDVYTLFWQESELIYSLQGQDRANLISIANQILEY